MIEALNLALFASAAVLVLVAVGTVDVAFSQPLSETRKRFHTAAAGQFAMVLVLCLLMERVG